MRAQRAIRGVGLAMNTVYIHSMSHRTNPIDANARPSPHDPQALKGRGTAWAIDHRFARQSAQVEDDGWGLLDQQATEEHIAPATQIIEERVKSILSSNDSPDISFDLSINPYRGCEH